MKLLLVGVLLCIIVAVGAAAVWVDTVLVAWTAALAAITAVIVACREHFPLSPTGPVALVVVTTGFLPAALGHLESTPVFAVDHDDYVQASIAFLVFICLALAVYVPGSPKLRERRSSLRTGWDLTRYAGGARVIYAIWAILAAVAVLLLASAAEVAGGFGGYIDGLANRRVFLEGRGYVLWALVSPAIASLVLMALVASEARNGNRAALLPLACAVTISAAFLFLTGNRMNLVVYSAAAAIVVHRCVFPLKPRNVLIGAVVVGLVALSIPSYLRPGTGSEGRVELRSPAAAFSDIDRYGAVSDFGQVAGLALVMSDPPGLERQYGLTYLAALTIGLPREVAPWKLPGAGEVITSRALPDTWYGGTSIQSSEVAEAYLNFGWAGVVIVGVGFGLLMRVLRRFEFRQDLVGILIYAVALPRLALLLRNEFTNILSFFVMELAVLLICLAALRMRSGSPSWTGTATPSATRSSAPAR